MKRAEFIASLERGLARRNVPDADEIIEEYQQHFVRKLADGYSEEEIAARLGNPDDLASQFPASAQDGSAAPQTVTGGVAVAKIGAGIVWFGAGTLLVLLGAWTLSLAAAAFAFAVLSLSLPFGSFGRMIVNFPSMPVLPSLLFAAATAGAAVLTAAATVYCFALMRRIAQSVARFCENAVTRGAKLPPKPVFPLLVPRADRFLRRVTLAALCVFVAFLAITYVVSAIMAGSLEFWHVWRWFV